MHKKEDRVCFLPIHRLWSQKKNSSRKKEGVLVRQLLRLTRNKLKSLQKSRKTNSPIHMDYRVNNRYRFPISYLSLKVWVLRAILRKKKISNSTAKAKKKLKKLRAAQMNPSIRSKYQFIPSSTITINVQIPMM